MNQKVKSLPDVMIILHRDVYHIHVGYSKSNGGLDVTEKSPDPNSAAAAKYIQQAVEIMTEEILRRASGLAYAEARDEIDKPEAKEAK